jgi:ribosomal protein S18 acetylase RimI-like enzyme
MVSIREVVRATDSALPPAHRILQRSFAKAELVSATEWRHSLWEREAGLWTDIAWHLVVAQRAGQILGLATGTYLGNVNTGVIGYLAVSRSARGLGLGPRLRAKLRRLFQRDAEIIRNEPLQAVVGEVRRDNPWLRTLMRQPRVLALDFPYLQPGLRRGEHPVPLVLYYESLDQVRRRLPAAQLRRLLYTMWRRVYRIGRPMRNAAFRRMLRDLAGRRFIGPITRAALER